MKEEEILGILPLHIRTIIKQADINWDELQEIRLRIQKPVILKYNAKTCYLSEQGKITTRKEQLHIVTSQEIRQAMEYISSYSMYAYIEQLKQGFLTIRGGHRVGICGTVVMDHDKVKTIRHISGLNIRVAHEVKGCADILYSRCTRMGKLIPTLIISPPGCGKTTLLRDMIRKISDEGQTVGVVDERSEIGACYQGVAQNDLGIQTDIMDACEKGQGMNMLIRSHGPRCDRCGRDRKQRRCGSLIFLCLPWLQHSCNGPWKEQRIVIQESLYAGDHQQKDVSALRDLRTAKPARLYRTDHR